MTRACRTCKATKPERQFYGTSRECMACAKARYKRNTANAKMRLALLEDVAQTARGVNEYVNPLALHMDTRCQDALWAAQDALKRLDAWERERG